MEDRLDLNCRLAPGCFATIAAAYENPEHVDDSPATAPSKRIQALCAGYDKVGEGLLAPEAIGLDRLRGACPHFGNWLTQLEALL